MRRGGAAGPRVCSACLAGCAGAGGHGGPRRDLPRLFQAVSRGSVVDGRLLAAVARHGWAVGPGCCDLASFGVGIGFPDAAIDLAGCGASRLAVAIRRIDMCSLPLPMMFLVCTSPLLRLVTFSGVYFASAGEW